MVAPRVEVDPGNKLRETISRAADRCQDLTPALILIAQYWFKSNSAIFSLKGKGKYADLSPRYKAWKNSLLGSPYPILMLHGRLMASITGQPNIESIQKIVNRKILVLGTSVPYATPLQEGAPSRNLPPRPVVMFGNEAVTPSALKTRVSAWEDIMIRYVAQATGAKL